MAETTTTRRALHTVADLGHAVRTLRTTKGWSQQQLAHEVGCGRLWISKLENGTQHLDFTLILRTLHALGHHLTLAPTATPTTQHPEVDAYLTTLLGAYDG